MTDLQTAVANLKTHIAAVQISAANVFPSTAVYLTTDPASQNTKRFPKAIIRVDGVRPHGEYPGVLQIADVSVELQQNTQPGPHGEGQFKGKHGKHGIEDIRAAVIAATGYLHSGSSPAIAPFCRLVDGGTGQTADGNVVSVVISYEMWLEV